MTLYRIDPNSSYLESVVDFVLKFYKDRMTELKIVVASGVICSKLQRIFVARSGASAAILPRILPIAAMSAESEFVYKVPSENIETMSYIAQKLALIDIIITSSHPELDSGSHEIPDQVRNDYNKASSLSDQLLKLFNEIEAGQIDINLLPGLVEIDSAEHWTLTAQFLTTAYHQWQEAITSAGKMSGAQYQKMILELEASEPTMPTIVVGIAWGSKAIEDFIVALATSEESAVILPPFTEEDITPDLSPTSPFYAIKRLVALCSEVVCHNISHPAKTCAMDDYPCLIEARDKFEEVELIAELIASKQADQTVALVTNNRSLISQIKIALRGLGVELNNLQGEALISTKSIEFMMLLSSSLLLDDIEKFAALLKTPYLSSLQGYEFEIKYLRGSGVSRIPMDDFWLKDQLAPLYQLQDISLPFSELLKIHIECALAIAPTLFQGEDGVAASEFLRELLEASNYIGNISTQTYTDLLKNLLLGATFVRAGKGEFPVAISPTDAAFLDFDIVILADCNEGSFPTKARPDLWMNNSMRQKLGLSSDGEIIGVNHYYFRLLVHKKLYITRSLKNSMGEEVASRFLHGVDCAVVIPDLIRDLRSNSHPELDPESREILNQVQDDQSKFAYTFPSSISATNIELLVRNPYGFYAKKILGLSKLKDINEEVSLADFGNLVHNIIGLYTENYDPSDGKIKRLLSIADKVFGEFHDHYKQNLWKQKFDAIAEEFIIFDEARRFEAASVHAEIYGETVISGVKVTAIADRIEVTKSGELFIMDYKTGAVPSKTEVRSGIAPQLVVEAIIAADGGFKGIPAIVATKLIYVKIGSSSPYLEVTEIEFDADELAAHKSGLESLLKHYTSGEGEFVATPNPLYEPKYNDYKHLARRL